MRHLTVNSETLKAPIKMSHCGHSFCSDCLGTYTSESESWACPKCRKINNCKVESLARNYDLEQAVESFASTFQLKTESDPIETVFKNSIAEVERKTSEILDAVINKADLQIAISFQTVRRTFFPIPVETMSFSLNCIVYTAQTILYGYFSLYFIVDQLEPIRKSS